jgi:hypothetical protein
MRDHDFLDELMAWATNTAQGLSGIPSEYRRGFPRKRALTCVQSGVVACQPLGDPVANQQKQALERLKSGVLTNQVLRFQKPT